VGQVGTGALKQSSERFAREIDQYLAGHLEKSDTLRVLSRTPEVLKAVGVPDLPITMTQGIFKKVTGAEKPGEHGLPVDLVKQLPAALDQPIMIFESDTQPDSIVVMTKLKYAKRPVLAILKPDVPAGRIQVNAIASVYAKTLDAPIVRWVNEGRLLYRHRQRSLEWFQSIGLQLPKEGTAQGKRKVLTDEDVVKPLYQESTSREKVVQQAETADFKRWFGDSRIVDQGGKPQVVYHSTSAPDFDAFKSSERDIGIHFGTAEQASDRADFKHPEGTPEGSRTLPAYLRIENPLRLSDPGAFFAEYLALPLEKSGKFTREEISQATGAPDRNGKFSSDAVTRLRALIESKGYDGIVYQNEAEAGQIGADSYVVFHPTQIKSALGNWGTFDPNNPDILMQAEGAKGAVEFLDDGRAIIHAFEAGDVSTVLHELGHIFRRDLGPKDLAAAERWAKVEGGEWTVEAEEKFARAFERYLREGKSPTPRLEAVFDRLKRWLTRIYRAIAGSPLDISLADEVREVFDHLLGGEVTKPRGAKATQTQRYSPEVRQAFGDWRSRRAYIDNAGNYRLKEKQVTDARGTRWTGKGTVAPWNRTVKKAFPDVTEFHDAAAEFEKEASQAGTGTIAAEERAEGFPAGAVAGAEAQTAGPRTYVHQQFGEVAESDDQDGVPRGHRRVIDAAGNEHIVQAQHRNQRMIEIGRRSERAEESEPEPTTPQDPITADVDDTAALLEEMAAQTGVTLMDMEVLPQSGHEKGKVSSTDVLQAYERVLRAAGRQVPIRRGRFRQGAAGIFKVGPEVIRVRSANTIPVASHEVGHALQKAVYGAAKRNMNRTLPPAVRRELFDLGVALYGSRRPAGGYVSEGFAEFMRHYLTRDDVSTVAPHSLGWFTGTVLPANPKVDAALKTARTLTDSFRLEGAENRAMANLDRPTLAKTIERAWRSLRSTPTYLVDEFTPLLKISEEAERTSGQTLEPGQNPFKVASFLRGNAPAVTHYMVWDGMVDFARNKVGPALEDAAAIVKGRKERFTIYLWARRAQERWAKGKDPGMSREDAEYLVAALGSPEFELAAQKVYDWNRGVLEYVKQAAPDLAPAIDAIQATSEFYVPLSRAFDEVDSKMVARLNGVAGGNPLKRMTGSSRRVKDIFPQMIANAERMIGLAHRKAVMDSVIRLSQMDGMGHIVEQVPVDQVPHTQEIARIAAQLQAAGADLTNVNLDELVTFFSPTFQKKGPDPIVPVMRGGKIEWYQVDPELYATLSGLDLYRLPKALDLMFGAPARAFRLGTTGLRAAFSLIRNPAKDVQTFITQTRSSENLARLAADYFRAGAEALDPRRLTGRKGEYLDAFYRLGVNLSQPLGQDVAITRKTAKGLFRGKAVRTVSSPIEAVRELFSVTESVPRVAEIRALAKEVGWDPSQPMTINQAVQLGLAAKQVTVDFTAAGVAGKKYNQMTPFFNANIQGTRQFARTLKERPGRSMMRGLVAFTIPTLLLWWKYKDEEWYRQMEDREKFSYWYFTVGDQLVRIPRAFEWGNLFATVPEAIFDSWYRKDPEGLKAAAGHIFETTVPLDLPHTLQVAKEQWQNRVDFFDQPIVPQSEQDVPPGEQFGPYTSAVAKWLGEKFPETLSPRRIDHLIKSLGGPAATDTLRGLEQAAGFKEKEEIKEPSELPVVGTLFRRGGKQGIRSKSVDKLYDEHSRAQAWHKSRIQEETAEQTEYREKLADAVQALRALDGAQRTFKLRPSDSQAQEFALAANTIAEDALNAKPELAVTPRDRTKGSAAEDRIRSVVESPGYSQPPADGGDLTRFRILALEEAQRTGRDDESKRRQPGSGDSAIILHNARVKLTAEGALAQVRQAEWYQKMNDADRRDFEARLNQRFGRARASVDDPESLGNGKERLDELREEVRAGDLFADIREKQEEKRVIRPRAFLQAPRLAQP
jgi:hypothetical protein